VVRVACLSMLVVMACRGRDEVGVREANAAAARGQLVPAEAGVRRAREDSPSNARLAALHGTLLWQLGRPEEAREAWLRAAELDPALPPARRGLAALGLAAGDGGLGLTSDDALLHARALLLRGAPGDGQAALELLPATGTPEARYVRGCALTATARYPEAQQLFEGLRESAPVLAAFGLARLAAARGQAGEALHQLANARTAAGAQWRPQAVGADPAFAFLTDSGDFKALLSSPP
jgi:tetratricopeptide (TPR) repeat protein